MDIQSAIKRGIGQFNADQALAKTRGVEFNSKRIFGGKNNFIKVTAVTFDKPCPLGHGSSHRKDILK